MNLISTALREMSQQQKPKPDPYRMGYWAGVRIGVFMTAAMFVLLIMLAWS